MNIISLLGCYVA